VLAACGCFGDAIDDLREKIDRRPRLSARNGLFRKLAGACLVADAGDRGLDLIARFIAGRMGGDTDAKLTDPHLPELSAAADAGLWLLFCKRFAPGVVFRRPLLDWLLRSDARFELLLETLGPEDDWPAALRILEEICDHDPGGRDAYFRLALALAVVWDRERPPPHPQMGPERLPANPDILARYDDFKKLYGGRRAGIPFRTLSVTALTYVVDLPMPLTEIAWIRKHVSPRNWKRKFFEIKYDYDRIRREPYQYQWPHGAYTFAAIMKQGGICVDQAYYAAMSARAFGIPALLFVGEGRRGPHAWYGYMKGTERWELDIGRYAYDKYATGHALDPQTNRFMTDHDVSFACDRALRAGRFREAARFSRLALVLHGLGYRQAAQQAARRSLRISPLYERSWRLLETLKQEDKDLRGLVQLYETEAGAFRKYPDYQAAIRRKQAAVLRRLGDEQAAERLLRRQKAHIERKRDDLARELASDRVKAAYERGDYSGARKCFENLLKKQKDEGQKVISLLDGYLDLTRKTRQTAAAARFLKRYIAGLEQRYGNVPKNRRLFLNLLLRAYENDGDKRNADRIRKKIDRLNK
jgi:hypothetical protein